MFVFDIFIKIANSFGLNPNLINIHSLYSFSVKDLFFPNSSLKFGKKCSKTLANNIHWFSDGHFFSFARTTNFLTIALSHKLLSHSVKSPCSDDSSHKMVNSLVNSDIKLLFSVHHLTNQNSLFAFCLIPGCETEVLVLGRLCFFH